MTIELIEPGLLTLVQGTPYRGMRHLGMPLAGAADPVALALANWLVGNGTEAAALETAYAPLSLRAISGCLIGIQGAATQVEINGMLHSTANSLALEAEDFVRIAAPSTGCRSYIAVHGGFAVELMLGSNSTYTPARLGGINGAALPAECRLETNEAAPSEARVLPEAYRLYHGNDFLLRVTAEPESDWIDLDALVDQRWTISRRADRIGMELDGEAIKTTHAAQMDSSAVFPGTIQCPPSGLPFLLGPDAQTTGGYPRIAQVIRADRHLIGQLRPGAHVRFQRIEPAEAQRLYRSKIALLRKVQPDIRLD